VIDIHLVIGFRDIQWTYLGIYIHFPAMHHAQALRKHQDHEGVMVYLFNKFSA